MSDANKKQMPIGHFDDFDDDYDDESDEIANFPYVCFLDLLGFTELLNQTKKSERVCDKHTYSDILIKIKYLGDIIQKYNSQNNHKQESLKILMISDSIYIFFKPESIKNFLHVVSLVNVYASTHDLYYRGAISLSDSISPTSDNTSLFIGDGIVESYTYERDIARYPRIVIKNNNDQLKNVDELKEYSLVDRDGIYRLDIWRYIEDEYDKIFMSYSSYKTSVVRMKECLDCDKAHSCEILKIPYDLELEYKSFVDKLLSVIDSKNFDSEKINSKYYEFSKILKGDV